MRCWHPLASFPGPKSRPGNEASTTCASHKPSIRYWGDMSFVQSGCSIFQFFEHLSFLKGLEQGHIICFLSTLERQHRPPKVNTFKCVVKWLLSVYTVVSVHTVVVECIYCGVVKYTGVISDA